MSEKNRDLYKSPKEQIEEMIDKKEIRKRNLIIKEIADLSLRLWNKYDVKATIKPDTKSMFLIINWNLLNIPLKKGKADNIISSIEEWLKNRINDSQLWKAKEITWIWDNNIYLTWDLTGRTIKVDDNILPTLFDSEIINSKEILSKQEIEEIFILIMKVKWIKKEDWDIESTVCRKNKITAECKDELWIK